MGVMGGTDGVPIFCEKLVKSGVETKISLAGFAVEAGFKMTEVGHGDVRFEWLSTQWFTTEGEQ